MVEDVICENTPIPVANETKSIGRKSESRELPSRLYLTLQNVSVSKLPEVHWLQNCVISSLSLH